MIYFRDQMHVVRHSHRRDIRGRQAQPRLWYLIASLPLVSLLGILWLWHDTGDAERIASHAEATFWYVPPSLPMFLVLPAMLRAGAGFWPSMGAGCVLTIVLYFTTALGLEEFGINL